MMRIFSCFFILALCLAGCSRSEQSAVIRLSNEGRVVDLLIPDGYLERKPKHPAESVWFKFDYPGLSPSSGDTSSNGIVSVLILNIANNRTRAEYILDAEVSQAYKSEFLERKKPSLEIEDSISDRQGSTYIKKTIFSRANDGVLICHEVVPDLRIRVSRRYSKFIELRYVISPERFPERERVDAAVIALLNKFSSKQL